MVSPKVKMERKSGEEKGYLLPSGTQFALRPPFRGRGGCVMMPFLKQVTLREASLYLLRLLLSPH